MGVHGLSLKITHKGRCFPVSPLEKMDAFFNTRAEIYDHHMLNDLGLDPFYKEIAAEFQRLPSPKTLLDLGCGTGLELERLFEQFPQLQVTGVDLSQGMLDLMQNKFPNKNLNLICGSYFDVPLGEACYDCAISTYSLHHFTREQKQELYTKICRALRPAGAFILGDYTVKTLQEEDHYLAESAKRNEEAGLYQGSCHYDTPFTAETETKLLLAAGFSDVRIVHKWDSTTIITAKKK